jgi:hypothetical protein
MKSCVVDVSGPVLDLTLQLAYSGWLGGLGLNHISQVRGKNTRTPDSNLPSFLSISVAQREIIVQSGFNFRTGTYFLI